jgi:CHRD domain
MKPRRAFLAFAMIAGVSTLGSSGAWALSKAPLFAVLSGGNEVGATGQAAAGDPDGYGTASVLFVENDRICISVLVNLIDKPTEAHIHEAPPGKEGPVVVPFLPPTTGNAGTSTACVSGLPTALVGRIINNPTNFYVNIHTAKFPEGAVRGNLF